MRRTMAAYLTEAISALRPALVPAAALAFFAAAPGVVWAVGPTVGVEAYGALESSHQAVVGDELVRVSDLGRPIEIEIWTNRGEGATYREGEEVGIRFRASRDCYVVIYDIDTEGFLTLLYPDDPYDDGFVRGGRVYRLPGPRAGYDLLAEGPPGVEYVAAVAGLIPLADRLPWYLAESYEAYGYRGHSDLDATVSDVGAVRGDPYVAMRDIAYDILPESIREREYDTDYTYFHVGREYRHPRYLCYDCHGRVGWLDPYHDSCSVFDIRIDLGWHFVSHPTFYYVGPRFWYWRRPDCPSIYIGFPNFWCSLYPRHFYRTYYWDGLVAVGLRHGRGRTVYPPPRYRGKPRHWGGYAGGDPGVRHYGRGADRKGVDPGGRAAGAKGRKYGGRGKPGAPRDIVRPERLAELKDVRLRSNGERGGRAGVVGRKSGRRADKPEATLSVRKARGAGGKSKAKVSVRKDTNRSKPQKRSARSGVSGSKKKGKAKTSSGRSRKGGSRAKR